MRFEIESSRMMRLLTRACAAVEKTPARMCLMNVRLTACAGNVVALASNGTVYVTATEAADIAEAGECYPQAHKLLATIRPLAARYDRLAVEAFREMLPPVDEFLPPPPPRYTAWELRVSDVAGASSRILPLPDPDGIAEVFPAVPDIGAESVAMMFLDADAMNERLSRIAEFASDDSTRPVLCGVLMERLETGVQFVAIDGHILSWAELPASARGDGAKLRTVIPTFAADVLGKGVASAERRGKWLRYSEGICHAVSELTGLRIVWKKIAGTFPDFNQPFQTDTAARATVGVKEARGAAKELLDVVKTEHMKRALVEFLPDRITLNAQTCDYSASETIKAATTVNGRRAMGEYNVAFLLKCLSQYPAASKVDVKLTWGGKPGDGQFVGEHGRDGFLLMPMKMRD